MLGNSFAENAAPRIARRVGMQSGPVGQQLLDRHVLKARIERVPVTVEETGESLTHRRRERQVSVADEGRHACGRNSLGHASNEARSVCISIMSAGEDRLAAA